MKYFRHVILLSLLAVTMLAPSSTLAQATWDPFDAVSKLVEWFAKLNAQFDRIVTVEQKGQLLRSVDRLRKDLYAVEADTRILLDSIPNERPDAEQNEQLRRLVEELIANVTRLGGTARKIGADLRMNEGEEIEDALTYGVRTRMYALTHLQLALADNTRPWDVQEIRARLDKGLQAIRAAQVAVTKFRQKLASSK